MPRWIAIFGLVLSTSAHAHAGRECFTPVIDVPRASLAPTDSLFPLTIGVVDGGTGAPIGARISVRDMSGSNYLPADSAGCLFHFGNGGYFYTHGTSDLSVPGGPLVVTVSRGLQYRAVTDTVYADSASGVTYAMYKWIDMGGRGFYGGDTHAHINHSGGVYTLTPNDAVWMAQAEGLNVANFLDNDYYFTGAIDPVSTSDCLVYFSEENRTGGYGHHGYLNITRLVEPLFGEPGWPLAMDLLDSVRTQPGAVIVATHPYTTGDFFQTDVWPGSGLNRELPLDALRGLVDCYDIAAYSSADFLRFGVDPWYRLLDCGARISPSAGTDASMNRNLDAPLGGYQVFVDMGGSSFTYANWCARLKRGRSFVTNGPMITRFTVGAKLAGDTLQLTAPGSVPVSVTVRSATPFTSLQIVANSAVVRSMAFVVPRTVLDTTFSVPLQSGAWVCARASGPRAAASTVGDSLYVHTGPVYVLVNGTRATSAGAAAYFVDWIDRTTAMLASHPDWVTGDDSLRVYAEFAAARAVYDSLAHPEGVTDVGDDAPPPADAYVTRQDGRVLFAAGAATGRALVYDIRGRVVAEMRREDDTHVSWDGRDANGLRVTHGVYFLRTPDRAARIVWMR